MIDMRVYICTDLKIDVHMYMCTDLMIDMHVHMCTDVMIDIHVYTHTQEHQINYVLIELDTCTHTGNM